MYKGQNKDNIIKGEWFNTFPKGFDVPGHRQFRDKQEEQETPNHLVDTVSYTINDWGYRGELIPKECADAAFGCSCTFGVGVSAPWPSMVGAVNCGQPGASNDKITRLAISYCETFKPNTIYVMWTYWQRREWIDDKGNVLAYKNQHINEDWANSHAILTNDVWDEYNYKKNQLLLRSYCELNNIELIETTVLDLNKDEYPLARDNNHPGADWHLNVSASLIT